MGRCLIVANQTLGGDALDQAVRERIRRGARRFFIVVPMTPPRQETSSWSMGFPLEDMPAEAVREAFAEDEQRQAEAFAAASHRARHRLDRMIDRVRGLGGDAVGEVGDPDPALAVRSILERDAFDEIIVSTLPAGLSRWLRLDLPSRIARMTSTPVVTVEAVVDADVTA